MASFRLVEQGELGVDEGAALLQRSLENLSWDWIDGIDEITADTSTEPFYVTSVNNSVVEAMVTLASRTLGGLGGAIWNISRKLSGLRWEHSPQTRKSNARPVTPRQATPGSIADTAWRHLALQVVVK